MTKTNHTRALLILLAALAAGLMALAGLTPREAQATFPGKNGEIAFASNRTTGQGVDNPEGDHEIFYEPGRHGSQAAHQEQPARSQPRLVAEWPAYSVHEQQGR